MPGYLKIEPPPGPELVLPVSPTTQHLIRAFLMNNGVSSAGTNQFVAGLIVTDAKDRQLLPALLAASARSR